MEVSAAFCREQEMGQLAKAASEPLENRRVIATAAAKAWAAEAAASDARESKQKTLDDLDVAITQEFAREVEADNRAEPLEPE
jgi:hypothetical protein